MPKELHLVLEDRSALAREYDANLRHGRALVPVFVGAERGETATLVVVCREDGSRFIACASVIVVLEDGPVTGTAVALDLASDDAGSRLARFVAGERDEAAPHPAGTDDPSLDGELPTLDFEDVGTQTITSDSEQNDEVDTDADEEARSSADPKIVRIRKLTQAERAKLAHTGQLEDRVMLERVFGKLVWDDLLRNPSVSVPEVARIAQKGTAPRHLLELIVDNQAWSRQSIVRRALLSNPRIGHDAVTKLLRTTPKPELKMMTQGTAYPLAVRGLAKKLLDD